MIRTIRVEPIDKDWRVTSAFSGDEMMFQSGAAAEAAANVLADALGKAGHRVQIELYLRDGSLAARRSPPPVKATPAARPDGRRALQSA